MLTTPPMDSILLHVSFLGLLFCFMRLPIFGVPREPREDNPADFGQHISAFGELLASTKNRAYALSRLEQYHHVTRAEPSVKSAVAMRSGVRADARPAIDSKDEGPSPLEPPSV
jgi:hypothetical protein